MKNEPRLIVTRKPTEVLSSTGGSVVPEGQTTRTTFAGFKIVIENPAGTVREGVDETGKPWRTEFAYAYGEIVGSLGVDGDPVDVYLGNDESATEVYIVRQMKRKDWDKFDEDKCFLGFPSMEAAKQAYLNHYDDPRFFGGIIAMPLEEFRTKVHATKEKPTMLKAIPVLFAKAYVAEHDRTLKNGKVVRVKAYHTKVPGKRPGFAQGQLDLFHSAPASTGSANRIARDPRGEAQFDLFTADPAPSVQVAEPPPLPRTLRELSPEDRETWRGLHQQHEEHVYHHIPRLEKQRAKVHQDEQELLGQVEEHRRMAEDARRFGDTGRAAEYEAFISKARVKLDDLATKARKLAHQIDDHQHQADALGVQKGRMIYGTGDLTWDTSAQRHREAPHHAQHIKAKQQEIAQRLREAKKAAIPVVTKDWRDETNWHSRTMGRMKTLSEEELRYIVKDATEAAESLEKMGGNSKKAGQYRDEAHYASMELNNRKGEPLNKALRISSIRRT